MIVGEELACERELGNSQDPYAVAVKNTIGGETEVVGHVPRSISAISLPFIRRGGIIRCEVTGIVDTQQICLKVGWKYVPCALHFITVDDKEDKKVKKLFQSTLSVKVEEVLLTTPQKLPVTMELTTTKLPAGTVNNEEAAVINVTKPDDISKLLPRTVDNEEASLYDC